MKQYVCTNPGHIARNLGCTIQSTHVSPSGPTCRPLQIKETKTEVAKSDFHICHNKDHVTADFECARIPYGSVSIYDPGCHPYKLTLVGLVEEQDSSDLEVVAGDWVLARGKVIGERSQGYVVRFTLPSGNPMEIAVRDTEILGTAKTPIPPQPNQTSLLMSQEKGLIFRWADLMLWHCQGDTAPGWRWKDLYAEFGPFNEYKSDGEIS